MTQTDFDKTLQEYAKAMSSTEPLHPDLVPYLEDGALGKMLRHPLVYQVPYFFSGYANRFYEQKVKDTKDALETGNYKSFVWLHERPYRLHAFMQIADYLSDSEYWNLLGSIWVDTENGWANLEQWRELLGSNRSGRQALMDWDEQMAYEGLADEVTVYRGCIPNLNEDGISWTLKREVAERFATRFSEDGVVLEKQISKRDIIAVFTGRNEFEAVIL